MFYYKIFSIELRCEWVINTKIFDFFHGMLLHSSIAIETCFGQLGSSLLLKLECLLVYIYICNELIEETARPRKLIFGMWGSFDYSSTKF